MVQNHHEFGDLLMWADAREIPVNVSVVRGPARCSIARLPEDELRRVAAGMEAQHDRVAPHLTVNRAVWDRELARVRHWAGAGTELMDDLWAVSRHATVLGLPGLGTPSHDERDAARVLTAFADDGEVHWAAVASDDIIQRTSPGLSEVLGLGDESLELAHVHALQAAVERRFGAMSSYDERPDGHDRIDATARFPGAEILTSRVALRDDRGRAVEGRLLLAIRTLEPAPHAR
jgi:hypothetical protein